MGALPAGVRRRGGGTSGWGGGGLGLAARSTSALVRTLAGLKENWAKLRKNQKGDVIRAMGDIATRKGQCLEPVTVVHLLP